MILFWYVWEVEQFFSLSLSQICPAKLLSLGALRYKNNIELGMICGVSSITVSKIET